LNKLIIGKFARSINVPEARMINSIENLLIEKMAEEGKCITHHEGKVIFVTGAVPGDVVDVTITKSKKDFSFAQVAKIVEPSKNRIDAPCSHFGVCGGCKWQHLAYPAQLKFKEELVEEAFEKIGKLNFPEPLPIIGADHIYYYRNKLEFTFSNNRWLEREQLEDPEINRNGVGFHIPKFFDKVLDINQCMLQADPSNPLRLAVKHFALTHDLTFYDLRKQTGDLRNMIIRTTIKGELMVIIVFANEYRPEYEELLLHVKNVFPQISSLMYVINTKRNDTIFDLPVHLFYGNDFITEQFGNLKFRIGPKSFFQTNSYQAEKLYSATKQLAQFKGDELLYDLYCGIGSISLFMADRVKKVIGIEILKEAIDDAKRNAEMNGITNCDFFAGDVLDVVNADFVLQNGKPDVVIIDPPRAGLHPKIPKKLIEMNPEKIIYVSCNPVTQARDLQLLTSNYSIEVVQPVDMFPHTQHVENIAVLKKLN